MFEEHYEEIDGVRIHYVDEGSGPPILMVHGQPTWGYLYRKMIPPLVAAGYRCIAPDLMGFGLSDKSVYTLRRHLELATAMVIYSASGRTMPVPGGRSQRWSCSPRM